MIQLPKSTVVGQVIPKEAFYKRLALSGELKARFVGDVQRFTIENSLTTASLNLERESVIEEILILAVDLKKRDIDYRIIESIAKNNPHKILFLLRVEGQVQWALYYKKLYVTDWSEGNQRMISVEGFSLVEIWVSMIEQIALNRDSKSLMTLADIDELLEKREAVFKLKAELEKTEKKARSERQPRKRYELAMRAQDIVNKLKEIESQ